VVATRIGGVADIVDNGVNGRLVEPEDSDLLASAIRDLMNDLGKRDQYGKAASEMVKSVHSLESRVDQYSKLYKGLICEP
jgi:glycosyltransferase involved in cell wall biosynthesis